MTRRFRNLCLAFGFQGLVCCQLRRGHRGKHQAMDRADVFYEWDAA